MPLASAEVLRTGLRMLPALLDLTADPAFLLAELHRTGRVPRPTALGCVGAMNPLTTYLRGTREPVLGQAPGVMVAAGDSQYKLVLATGFSLGEVLDRMAGDVPVVVGLLAPAIGPLPTLTWYCGEVPVLSCPIAARLCALASTCRLEPLRSSLAAGVEVMASCPVAVPIAGSSSGPWQVGGLTVCRATDQDLVVMGGPPFPEAPEHEVRALTYVAPGLPFEQQAVYAALRSAGLDVSRARAAVGLLLV